MSDKEKSEEKKDGVGDKLLRLADKLTQRVNRAADEVEKTFDSAADSVTPKILRKSAKKKSDSEKKS